MTSIEDLIESDCLLKSAEVCHVLNVSNSTLSRWRHAGEGPRCVWLSAGCPRYRPADLIDWLTRRGI